MKYPNPERPTRISQGLDAYKATMSQLAFEKHPDTEVKFELKNRSSAQKLVEYVNPVALQERLDSFAHGWEEDEILFLASQLRKGDAGTLYGQEFLDYLRNHPLPPVNVYIDAETEDIAVSTAGPWPLVTFWETVVMSEVNEMYFESFVTNNGLDLGAIYSEGDSRLSDKIAKLRARQDIKFADFGTRRRFSYRWQKHVVERLVNECPDNFIGTSNLWLANELDVMPIGTFAHEMPMVYAALARKSGINPLDGHTDMLRDWSDFYGDNLSTALTDTFTSEYFFADFTAEQAAKWASLRQDSGDPIDFGERAIEVYKSFGIDPMTKTIVFSDGLDIDTIIALADTFKGRINVIFGWGTTLTNDLGLQSLNIVMKATEANGEPTVKLSDDHGKEMGPEDVVADYRQKVGECILEKLGVRI